jgi:hypothetical protein
VSDAPWQLEDGTSVEGEFYDGASSRTTATVVDPTLGQDIVVFSLKKMPYISTATNCIISNRTTSRGWMLYSRFGAHGFFIRDNVDPDAALLVAAPYSAWSLVIIIIDYNALTHLVVNGNAAGTANTPSGDVLGQSWGVGIASVPNSTSIMEDGGEIAFAGFYYGTGIADAWFADSYAQAKDFTCRFSGVCPTLGSVSSFTRNSAASWEDHNGIWRISANHFPRSGDSGGLRVGPTRTTKVYNSINPALINGWAVTGGTHTVVDDSSQLTADGLPDFGPKVHQFVPGGADQVIYSAVSTGNTNAHSISVFMRGPAGGESVDLGVRDQSTGVVTNLGTQVLTTSWVRYVINGFTPGDTDERFCLDCDAGDTILFILPQLEEGAVATTPIPNWSTGATATRSGEILQTDQALLDVQGSIETEITPLGWSGGAGGSSELVARSGASANLIYASSAGVYVSEDSGGAVLGTYAPVDGTKTTCRSRWADSGELSLTDASGRTSKTYSGTLRSSGDLRLLASTKEAAFEDLKVYRNGDG